MRFRKIIKLFESGNVSVCGLRGTGKDLLMSNVVVRRKLPYISNIDYGGDHIPFNYDDLDCGRNTYANFISGDITPYKFPYPDGTDVYLSDAGIYFPAQYCNELNRKYPYLSVYQAISRHVANANFHYNAQACNRVYDKIREQASIFVLCRGCIYFHGLVLQAVTIYERYESAVAHQRPLRLPRPILGNRETRMMYENQMASYEATHGKIQERILIYFNKSNYDTRQFRKILSAGAVHNAQSDSQDPARSFVHFIQ